MDPAEINVMKEEQFFTNRKVVVPASKDVAIDTVATICAELSKEKVTGQITLAFNQGGIRLITVDENARVLPGSPVHDVVEKIMSGI